MDFYNDLYNHLNNRWATMFLLFQSTLQSIPVGLVPAGVCLSACQPRVLLICHTVDTRVVTVGMLLLHMNLQCLLVS